MPLPTIAFGILLAICCGAVYHFFRGGSSKKLALYLLLALAGFWTGDTLGWYLGWSVLPVGVLNAGTGAIFSFIFLGLGDLISGRISPAEE